MRASRLHRISLPAAAKCLAAAMVCAIIASTTAGCDSHHSATPRQARGTTFARATRDDVIAARFQAMAAADTYVTVVAQAADELRAKTSRPEVVMWAIEQRVATGLSCYTNATEINGYVALLDMLVFSTLKARAIEHHWIPTLLHEEGKPLLEAYRRGERDVWGLGAKVLSEKQLAELRKIIDDWQAANPTQYYIAFIRFTDFAHAMHVSADSSKAKSANSVFGLLYIDPLAGLDPVAREMQEFRAVTERLSYFINRLPIVLSWQLELAVRQTTNDPQMLRFVDNTSKFAEATRKFSDSIAGWPEHVTAERTAAIEQLNSATTQQVKNAIDEAFNRIAEQRVALTKDLQGHEDRLDATADKIRGIVERARDAGTAIKTSTAGAVENAEQSSRRVLNHAFRLTVALILIILFAMLLYRVVVQRRPRGAVVAACVIALHGTGGGCFYQSRPAVDEEKLLERRERADEENAVATSKMVSTVVARTKLQLDAFNAGQHKSPPVIDILIISGGGDWGAFGAGFLKGWHRVPPDDVLAKPEFDIVTGVSTGSLIAPFAFLGDEASIDRIVHLYRNPKKDWVRRRGILYFLPSKASFAEVPGLERELSNALTPEVVGRLAKEGDNGRTLLVNTTNVDDGGPRVFNLVDEARRVTESGASDSPRHMKRLHNIILASCGIPAAFPFRVIGDELYVDGGVTGNIIYGGRIRENDGVISHWVAQHPGDPMPKVRYWVIFNNWLRPHPQVTPPNWPAVISRSLEMGTRAATLTSLRHLHAMAEIARLKYEADVEVRVVAVPESWTPPKPGVFVRRTMNELADLGERLGADPASWQTTPP